MDAEWGRRPLSRFATYRRIIARRNWRARFEELEKALKNYDSSNSDYSELQIVATYQEKSVARI